VCDAVALPIPLDLTDSKSIASAANWVEKEYGGILAVLVNNAAICFNDPPYCMARWNTYCLNIKRMLLFKQTTLERWM